MCDNFKCLGMDASLSVFNPCFFAFLAISISIFDIFKYYFFTSFYAFLNPLIDFESVNKNTSMHAGMCLV